MGDNLLDQQGLVAGSQGSDLLGYRSGPVDLAEVDGKTWLYYAVGDQRTWMNIKRAVFNGSVAQFLESWFMTPCIPDRN